MYKRKTKDVYQILCDYGNGLEVVTEEETFRDCKRMLNDYIKNDYYARRITYKKIRERIE